MITTTNMIVKISQNIIASFIESRKKTNVHGFAVMKMDAQPQSITKHNLEKYWKQPGKKKIISEKFHFVGGWVHRISLF